MSREIDLTPLDHGFSGESAARRCLDEIEQDVGDTLTPSKASLTEDDRHLLQQSKVQMRPAFESIANCIEYLRHTEPEKFRIAYGCIHQLMIGAFYAGAFCVVSDSTREHLREPFTAGGSRGGKNRGKQLQEEADQRWRNEAKGIWKAKRGDLVKGASGRLSQEKLADEIVRKINAAPDRRQIVSFIRELEQGKK